jgi:DNA-directed RNA polymerase alpha subunit
MLPRIDGRIEESDGIIKFTLRDINVSLANSIRRTILSDIPTVIFKTSPHDQNKSNFITNTSRLNNEILKQRLSCIPINITDMEMPLEKYMVEINVENLTDTIIYVTTENFKIKNLDTGDWLKDKDRDIIFPPNVVSGYYIDFARLRPKISDEIPGEKLHLTCEFSLGTAKEDGMFNVVSTCSYGFTQDTESIELALRKKEQEWRDTGLSPQDIKFYTKDFMLLDAQRIVKRDSFDFIIQSVGVFDNRDIIKKAATILNKKLNLLETSIETESGDEPLIIPSENTMKNCYDIILKNEDYTIGKVIEYYLYTNFYEGKKILSYCGFKKMHPHDSDSIIRVSYKEEVEKMNIIADLKECIANAKAVYDTIIDLF